MEGYDSAGWILGRILALENCRPNYSTTTLHCSSPVPCKAIPKAELYTLLHNFHKSLNFQLFAKMYHRKFFTHEKRFSCSDRKTVNEQDPVVSIALLTVANSSEQQFSSGCLINLACMPHPTVHGMQMPQFHKIISMKCSITAICKKKHRAVEILHYTVRPSCDGIGIGILSVNTAYKILL